MRSRFRKLNYYRAKSFNRGIAFRRMARRARRLRRRR